MNLDNVHCCAKFLYLTDVSIDWEDSTLLESCALPHDIFCLFYTSRLEFRISGKPDNRILCNVSEIYPDQNPEEQPYGVRRKYCQKCRHILDKNIKKCFLLSENPCHKPLEVGRQVCIHYPLEDGGCHVLILQRYAIFLKRRPKHYAFFH